MNGISIPKAVSDGLYAGCLWWRGEIAAIQSDLACLTNRKSASAELIVKRSGFVLSCSSTGHPFAAECENVAELSGQLRTFRSATPIGSKMRLCIAPDACLRRLMNLPAAAAGGRLESILELEIKRATPFETSEVFHGYRIRSRDSDDRQVLVDHIIIKKDVLAPAIRVLSSNGVQLSRQITVLNEAAPFAVELLPDIRSEDPKRPKLRQLRAMSMTAAAGSILLLVGVMEWRQSVALSKLSLATEAIMPRAAEVRAKLTDLKEADKRVAALRQLRKQAIPVAALWEELTRLVPDNAWITQMQMEENSIVLTGFAASSADLLVRIGASPRFVRAGFTSPVSKIAGRDHEQFSIRIEMTGQSPWTAVR